LETGYIAGKMDLNRTDHCVIIIVLDVMEEPDDLCLHMRNHHRTVAIALGIMVAPNDQGLHAMKNHRDSTAAPGMGAEVDDPGHHSEHTVIHMREMQEIQSHKHKSTNSATSGTNTIMRMKKNQLELPALPTGFAECKYQKDSSYLMISRNTMDPRNPSRSY
jgi:hypothetical protein